MSATALFDAARAHKRELTGNALDTLTQADVDGLNAVLARWKPAEATRQPTALADAQAFYKSLRAAFGGLEQSQVEGFNALLTAMGKARWPIAWAAYGAATAWHETAKTMQPVREAYWLSEAWRKRNLRYYPWYGRGFCQITWEANYVRADEELELGGRLIADLDLALDCDIAAQILCRGMEQGWFTNKRLADYLPLSGHAGHDAYKRARKIINGTDKDAEIAKIALSFEAALDLGGWA